MADSETLFGDAHVEAYLATDGERGYEWEGTEILILFTRGRKTGEERRHPLIFRHWGEDSYLIVASKGGAPTPPAWLLNLQDDPAPEIQVKGDRFVVDARIADDEEKPAMWADLLTVWPAYDDYQAKTDRVIPVVVLTRRR